MQSARLWLGAFILCCAATAAAAQPSSESGTLEKISGLGTVFLGYRESSPPFSYHLGDKGVGFSVELCERVVDAIRLRLGRADLKLVYVPLPASLRFSMVIDGVADMECGVSTNTKARQQRMAFSVSFFESQAKFLVRKESQIENIRHLDGKTIVIGAATTQGRTVSTVAKRHNISVRLVIARSRDEAINMLAGGKADAYSGDDALLLGALLGRPDRQGFRLLDDPISVEPYGIVVRRDDPEFKKLVDDTLTALMKSGEIEQIYNRWFMAPITPHGRSLEMPLDQRTKALYLTPSDAGI